MILSCKIVNAGRPPAEFYWERYDERVTNKPLSTNDTHTMLKLTNLTNADHGEYKCVAEGVLSLERHSILLEIKSKENYYRIFSEHLYICRG